MNWYRRVPADHGWNVIGRSCPKPDLAEIRNSGTTGHMPALDQLVCASLLLQVSIPPV
jgi:hypothetical protein